MISVIMEKEDRRDTEDLPAYRVFLDLRVPLVSRELQESLDQVVPGGPKDQLDLLERKDTWDRQDPWDLQEPVDSVERLDHRYCFGSVILTWKYQTPRFIGWGHRILLISRILNLFGEFKVDESILN